jgi:hypothetical protein
LPRSIIITCPDKLFTFIDVSLSPMKRKQLIKHIKKYDGFLLREGSRHGIYQRGRLKTEVPRHNEIVDELARKICKDLDIPFVR